MTDSDSVAARFYDDLSSSYDAMTSFRRRFEAEAPSFRQIVESNKIKTAIDAGAGTGFHSILLSQLGVDVIAIDVSQAMLAHAAQNAAAAGVNIQFVQSTFADIGTIIETSVDAVFCLGNSFAHMLTDEAAVETLRSFHAVLKPGGLLMIQVVNYAKIVGSQNRIQSVKESEEKTFVRFYDFLPDKIIFNILTFERDARGLHHNLASIPLRPIYLPQMTNLLTSEGFSHPTSFGSIDGQPYDHENSSDLVLFSHRCT